MTPSSRRPDSAPGLRGGQVLATDVVRVDGRSAQPLTQCRSLGELTLKGLPDPVETVEVGLGAASDDVEAGVVPSRCRAASAVRPVIGVVGRDAEVEP